MTTPSKLKLVLQAVHDERTLVRDAELRSFLTDTLSRSEAKEMVSRLGIKSNDPYESLRRLKPRKGSAVEDLLFLLLNVELEAGDRESEVVQPNIEVANADYALFKHQRTAVRQCADILSQSQGRVLLHMPTGSGKTRTAMHLVAQYLAANEPSVVTWLASSEELCSQAAEEFERAWKSLGNRRVNVYRHWAHFNAPLDSISDGFVVAGLPKLYAGARGDTRFITGLSDRSRFVIIDEAHQSIAETYRFVIEMLVERDSDTRLLGLSATPGRTWNDVDEDSKLAEFFNHRKVALQIDGFSSPVEYLHREGYLARPNFERLVFSGGPLLDSTQTADLSRRLDLSERMLAQLAENDQRNLLILDRAEQLLRVHRRVIVFSASLQHARLLAAVLVARGHDAAAVYGTSTAYDRRAIIERYKSDERRPMVLVNYGVLTTGFDAPATSAALICRPTRSLVLYSQMVGRAIRGPKAGGNEEATIVTVVDTNLPGFGTIAEAFENWEDVWQ